MRAAIIHIIAGFTDKCIITIFTVQRIITTLTEQRIVPVTAINNIVPAGTKECVITTIAIQTVRIRAADKGIFCI